jgi:hypothetical protein
MVMVLDRWIRSFPVMSEMRICNEVKMLYFSHGAVERLCVH